MLTRSVNILLGRKKRVRCSLAGILRRPADRISREQNLVLLVSGEKRLRLLRHLHRCPGLCTHSYLGKGTGRRSQFFTGGIIVRTSGFWRSSAMLSGMLSRRQPAEGSLLGLPYSGSTTSTGLVVLDRKLASSYLNMFFSRIVVLI